jgi:hypothetical protein
LINKDGIYNVDVFKFVVVVLIALIILVLNVLILILLDSIELILSVELTVKEFVKIVELYDVDAYRYDIFIFLELSVLAVSVELTIK